MLRLCRELRGYSHEEAADLTGVSKDTIQNWEAGKSEPSFSAVLQLVVGAYKIDLIKMTEALGGCNV